MCIRDRPISAQEALTLAIVDRIIDGDLLTGAVAFAREVADRPAPKSRQRNEKLSNVDPSIFAIARDTARKTKRGQPAPLAAIDAVEASTKLPFEEGCKLEAKPVSYTHLESSIANSAGRSVPRGFSPDVIFWNSRM